MATIQITPKKKKRRRVNVGTPGTPSLKSPSGKRFCRPVSYISNILKPTNVINSISPKLLKYHGSIPV